MTRIVKSERVREGYANITVLTLADDQGEEHQREVVSFGEAVCVLPFDPARRVCLVVRLPRAPLLWAGIEAELIEAPAGMIDPGEAPEATARREAFEEAGVGLGALELVATCWTSPGVVAERVHLFLAPYGASDRKAAGVVFNFKEGRPILGSLYAIALTEVVVFLPLITAKLGINLL